MRKETSAFIEKVRDKFRYGLVLNAVLSNLPRLGIAVSLQYWIREGIFEGEVPSLGPIGEGYSFEPLGIADLKTDGNIPGREIHSEDVLIDRLKQGNVCIAAKYRDRIVACAWCDLRGREIERPYLSLRPGEAYLYDMITMKDFRGKNIAPHLRYHCYLALEEMGISTCYSISDYFNKPAIKFKKKLNARFVDLWLDIRLFKRFRWYWKIRHLIDDPKMP